MYSKKPVLRSDVAGEDEAKESLQEVVDFLHNPGKYTTIGENCPKEPFVGPPGTGTRLRKAVAGEAHVPFFSLRQGLILVVDVCRCGASRVRDLFEEAKKNAPCIILLMKLMQSEAVTAGMVAVTMNGNRHEPAACGDGML